MADNTVKVVNASEAYNGCDATAARFRPADGDIRAAGSHSLRNSCQGDSAAGPGDRNLARGKVNRRLVVGMTASHAGVRHRQAIRPSWRSGCTAGSGSPTRARPPDFGHRPDVFKRGVECYYDASWSSTIYTGSNSARPSRPSPDRRVRRAMASCRSRGLDDWLRSHPSEMELWCGAEELSRNVRLPLTEWLGTNVKAFYWRRPHGRASATSNPRNWILGRKPKRWTACPSPTRPSRPTRVAFAVRLIDGLRLDRGSDTAGHHGLQL